MSLKFEQASDRLLAIFVIKHLHTSRGSSCILWFILGAVSSLYTSKEALDEYFLAHRLSGFFKQTPLLQQDSGATVVSSSSPNRSMASNMIIPCDGYDMLNRIILKCFNSSPSKQSQELPHDLRNKPRYTNEQNHRQQLFASMLFGCSATINKTNTNRANQLVSINNLQKNLEQKQQQWFIITILNRWIFGIYRI